MTYRSSRFTGGTAPMGNNTVTPSEARHAVERLKPGSTCYRHSAIFRQANGRTIAHWYPCDTYSRKVRAPVDRLPGNAWARAARAGRDGKCHREQTAIF